MADYRLTTVDTVIRVADGAYVSDRDPTYRAWLQAGNVPDPADPVPARGPDLLAQAAEALQEAAVTEAGLSDGFKARLGALIAALLADRGSMS